ncbi:MAG: hypothetical protein IJ113_05385 [Eggerthellaceae bacterium]|nr:hypothetical protein [Eggerthellaceae bacterium]
MDFAEGSMVYIVENNLRIRKAVVLKASVGLFTIQFEGGKGAIRVSRNRLFETEEAAQASIRKPKPRL